MLDDFCLDGFDDLDDTDLATVNYEVWVVSKNADNVAIGIDHLLSSFRDPDDAIAFAEIISISDIRLNDEAEYYSVEVETASIVDGDHMNLGTIYRKAIYNEPTSVQLTITDYELLEDGRLKIPYQLVHNHITDNNTFTVVFSDEGAKSVFTLVVLECTSSCDSYICDIVV